MFEFGADRPRRRPNLTPMIDVVFLLLVFFMLASRFGTDMTLPLTVAGQGGGYSGPPRLVDISPEALSLNGSPIAPEVLAEALAALTEDPGDAIVLRARDEATLQQVIAVMDVLKAAGFTRLVLVE
ncbi:ExbD/TolR family protein [Frigidibacter mobilis]|uniref:Biopolymer transport protein ExbD/TolR n=1 Tax=Frigidibacter mobilis TaxID=1335048 RepID=A0A159Z262_9RHOB|nr:biopolymer transporter ExbD [Frigidibacter mobilis]AMY68090.1 biopolymer transport protein ExbD/TolR [Frigidibacter mobilis]